MTTAPKSFSQDSAGGSGGGGTTVVGNPANTGQGNISDTQAVADYGSGILGNGAVNGFGGQWQQAPASNDPVGSDAWKAEQNGTLNNTTLMFDGGGSVPDDQPDPGSADRIAVALASVDSALSYGRKLHGLPDDSGMDEGNGSASNLQQEAANRMPSIPGNPSDSGVKPMQPMPGPLPPTSNPFGKRTADAGASSVGASEEPPTIPDNDEETS